jgi:hypothetical protein
MSKQLLGLGFDFDGSKVTAIEKTGVTLENGKVYTLSEVEKIMESK